MKATVKMFFFNAKKVVKISNPQFKLVQTFGRSYVYVYVSCKCFSYAVRQQEVKFKVKQINV